MPYSEYLSTHLDDIQASENEVDRTWDKVLALLIFWDLFMRRQGIAALSTIPVVETGLGAVFDGRRPSKILAAQEEIRRQAHRMDRELRLAIAGVVSAIAAPSLGKRRRVATAGITPEAINRRSTGFTAAWARGERIRIRDERVLLGGSLTNEEVVARRGEVAARVLSEDQVSALASQTAAAVALRGNFQEREFDELYANTQASIINIVANLGYDARRVVETVLELAEAGRPRDEAVAYLNGSGDRRESRGLAGWRHTRGPINLSATAHIRGVNRGRLLQESVKSGISSFRLDVPRSKLGNVSGGGFIGRNLWIVRDLAGWRRVQSAANTGRIASSSLGGLGFHYGDFSYLTPVPPVYLREARRRARLLRGRWLALGSGVAALAAIRREGQAA